MKKVYFVLLSLWILFSRAYDTYSTYLYTPDLSREANPLSSILGLGWRPLLFIVGGLTLYALYCFYVHTFRSFDFLPTEKGYSLEEFSTYVFLGRKERWWALFYKRPNSLKRLNHYLGHFLTLFLAYAGIVSTVMWLLLNHTDWYPNYHRASIIYTLIIVGCLLIGFYSNYQLYRKYQQKTVL